MFEIDENNLPFVRTRQALLVLDLQNEFLSPGGNLLVEHPHGFVDNILRVIPEFRPTGNIIWVRSVFESSRSINESGNDSEKIITDKEVTASLKPREPAQAQYSRTQPSETIMERFNRLSANNGRIAKMAALMSEYGEEDDEKSPEEAFLTVLDGTEPRFVLRRSDAANVAAAVAAAYDPRDIVTLKTHYSAFKDGSLVQTLRSKFVTELYICGALSNVSVFATAMDAAQFGYAISIVDDCLGYRSQSRHEESLRRLIESTGCDIVSSNDLINDLKQKAKVVQRPMPAPRPRPQTSRQREKKVRDSELDSMMSKLNLRPEAASSGPRTETSPPCVIAAESAPVASTEPNGSSESQSPDSQLDEISITLPRRAGSGDKPERVKSKVKTRRRPSKPTPKESSSSPDGSPAAPNPTTSPTPVTLMATSNVLENIATPIVEDKSQMNTEESKSDEAPVSKSPKATQSSNPKKMDKPETPSPNVSVPSSILKEKKQSSSDNGTYSDAICEGDTRIIHNLLDAEKADGIFEKLRDEVRWQKMSHQGGDVPRLVAVQGSSADDGSIPIYRHPSDESPPLLPFSPTVCLIRAEAEKHLGHPLNHVLIQFYRDGSDYISEHSDKTLDIAPNSFIVNVSLGAQRTMIFRTKKQQTSEGPTETAEKVKPRQATRAPLPHNSMCKVGLVTNMRWLHGIRQDKRLPAEKSEAELAFNGARISLTFRQIGTFLSKDQQKIWGQGATTKDQKDAQTVINGRTPEAETMIRAFGRENHSSEFNWDEFYGKGFDVLHINNSSRLFLSGDKLVDLRVKISLAEYGIDWEEGKLSPSFNWKDGSSQADAPSIPERLPVKFVDNDLSKSTVIGDTAILLYLDAVYGSKTKSQSDIATQFTRVQHVADLHRKWNIQPFNIKPFKRELELWEVFAKEGEYIAGDNVSVADFLLWPILDEIHAEWGLGEGLERLEIYHKTMRERDIVVKVLGKVEEEKK